MAKVKDGESGSSHPICVDENNLWPFPAEDIDHCVACLRVIKAIGSKTWLP